MDCGAFVQFQGNKKKLDWPDAGLWIGNRFLTDLKCS